MPNRSRLSSARSVLIAASSVVALAGGLLAAGGFAQEGGAAPPAKLAAIGPDVTVFAFTDIGNYGSSGGYAAYAVGTRSCNRGDTPLNWCDQASGCAPGATTHDHPVIAQNLYRLKDGRFEQIGMSWLKHGFTSTNSTTAGCAGATGASCSSPPAGGNQLGVGCTDPYSASLNGSRPLGKRSEVNATTGAYPFPYGAVAASAVYDQRVKVATADLDSTLNPGALYFAEGQYIAPDDAAAGNAANNASYRRVTVGASPSFPLTMTGTFFEKQPALNAWRAADPSVFLYDADVPGTISERFQVARKVTDLGTGVWHYEYAVRNHNSDRGARAFRVTFPAATTFSNVGFKDIDSHSGEVYATTDWTPATTADAVSWTSLDFATDANANALRFASMYNFWFDADRPPSDGASSVHHLIELFKPGSPTELKFDGFNDLFGNGFEGGNYNAWSGHS